jgi:cis-L-3-hydroxyproline dehydratase
MPGLKMLECFAVEIPPLEDTYQMSHGRVLRSFSSTVVKITASDGTVGFGEACLLGANYSDGFAGSARATISALAPWVLTCDPLEAGTLVDGMDARLTGHLPGKAAIDIAMWDLRGKLLGQPVARLLGGIKQPSFGVFQAISMADPDAMAAEISRLTELGFRRWQLKLGSDPLQDARRVHAAVAALPDDSAFLTCDANRGWTVAQTLRFLERIESVDSYLEQPCATTAELVKVRRHCRLPMIIDESVITTPDLLDAVASDAADAINLKPVRVGGLTKACRIRDIAEACGLMILVDEPQGADLATASMAHLAATIAPERFLASSYFMGDHMRLTYQPAERRSNLAFEDGFISLDDRAPGLGIEVEESILGDPLFRAASEE